MILVAEQIAEGRGVIEREAKRFGGFVKAQDLQLRRNIVESVQDGDWVGSSAEADVPNDELRRMMLYAITELQLSNVERFCFGLRTDDGMKCLAIAERMDAVSSTRELDDAVTGVARHDGSWRRWVREGKSDVEREGERGAWEHGPVEYFGVVL